MVLSPSGLSRDRACIRRVRYVMGTFVEIEVACEHQPQAADAIEAAFSEFRRLEGLLSKFIPDSPVGQVNRFGSGYPVEVPREMFDLTERAVRFSEKTSGAFDITVNPLMELWGTAEMKGILPRDEEIMSALAKVDTQHLLLSAEDSTIGFKAPGCQIDFGAIGKGYAMDRAVEVLKRYEVTHALVNAGGAISCLDEYPSAIGIRNPLDAEDLLASVTLQNNSVATSASGERFFRIGGDRYSHVIDPRTGNPVHHHLVSATVIADTAELADVFSTAVFVLGLNRGMDLIEATEGLEAVLLRGYSSPFEVHISSGLKETSRTTPTNF